jgi:hypothetical protein
VEGDGFSVFLDLVGTGRGPGARVRRWSAIVFILSLIMGGFAVYMWWGTVPRKATAAEFEAGIKGSSFWYRTRRQGLVYEISGYLVASEAVTVNQFNGDWIYAPLVSEPGTGKEPRIYFAATEKAYHRARAENRYAGFLRPYVIPSVRSQLAAQGLVPGTGALFLEDSGTLRGAAAGAISLIVFALVGALASLFLFLMAARRARPDDDVAASSLMPSPLPDRPNPSP